MPTEKQILQVLASSKNPLKARAIATLLSKGEGEPVTRREVNSLLFRMKSRREVIQDESFCWRIEDGKGGGTDAQPTKRPASYYDILEVAPFAHDRVIEKAYKTLVNLYHPDRADDLHRKEFEERMKLINLAYEILSDPHKRKDYDDKLSI